MSEYLDEEEQVARLKTWWNENGISTVVMVLAAVGAVVAWRWYGDYQETRMHEASKAYAAYVEDRDEAAISVISTEFAGSTYHILVLLDQAREAVEEGDMVQAQAFLQSAVELSNSAMLADLARVRLAKVQQALDQGDAALATLAGIKSEGYTPLALEVKGDILTRRGQLSEAYASYLAAVDALGEGVDRPILKMKLANAAPYDGEFVQAQNDLSEALEAAQETLETTVEDERAESIDATLPQPQTEQLPEEQSIDDE